jgi:hypothetical protein
LSTDHAAIGLTQQSADSAALFFAQRPAFRNTEHAAVYAAHFVAQ